MHVVRQRFHVRELPVARDVAVGVAFSFPGVVDVDVNVAGITHAALHHGIGDLADGLVVDGMLELVPAVPTHRRGAREAVVGEIAQRWTRRARRPGDVGWDADELTRSRHGRSGPGHHKSFAGRPAFIAENPWFRNRFVRSGPSGQEHREPQQPSPEGSFGERSVSPAEPSGVQRGTGDQFTLLLQLEIGFVEGAVAPWHPENPIVAQAPLRQGRLRTDQQDGRTFQDPAEREQHPVQPVQQAQAAGPAPRFTGEPGRGPGGRRGAGYTGRIYHVAAVGNSGAYGAGGRGSLHHINVWSGWHSGDRDFVREDRGRRTRSASRGNEPGSSIFVAFAAHHRRFESSSGCDAA